MENALHRLDEVALLDWRCIWRVRVDLDLQRTAFNRARELGQLELWHRTDPSGSGNPGRTIRRAARAKHVSAVRCSRLAQSARRNDREGNQLSPNPGRSVL